MKERVNNLGSYFGLFKGEAHPMSEMSDVVRPAVDILVTERKAIEQLALDGDSLIFIPDAVKKNLNPDHSFPPKHQPMADISQMET